MTRPTPKLILERPSAALALVLQPGDGPAAESPPGSAEALDLVLDKLNGWLELAIVKLPNLVVAVVVALCFFLLARILRSVLARGLEKTPMAPPIRHLLLTSVAFLVTVAGFFIALGVLGLDKTVTSLLAGVGILGLALGFAFQDIAANFMAGIFLSFRRPFHVGQIIETNDYFGTVEEITLRSTILRKPTGEIVRIPNKQVFESPVVNFSHSGKRRVDLPVGVSYGDDLERAREVAVAAVESIGSRDSTRPVELFYTGFGGSSIDFVVRFWVDYRRQPDYLGARSDAILAIHRAFDEAGLTIPFPIRTLDFGIVGGETLADALGPVVGSSDHPPGRAAPSRPAADAGSGRKAPLSTDPNL